jgi:hypothetical protein
LVLDFEVGQSVFVLCVLVYIIDPERVDRLVSTESDETLASAVGAYPNLVRASFRRSYRSKYQDLVQTQAAMLARTSCLLTLDIWGGTNNLHPDWMKCSRLEALTIQYPGRLIIETLPQWLDSLRGSLRTL